MLLETGYMILLTDGLTFVIIMYRSFFVDTYRKTTTKLFRYFKIHVVKFYSFQLDDELSKDTFLI